MDNIRLFLFLALAFVGMLLWQSWQEDYGSTTPPIQQQAAPQLPMADGETPEAPTVASNDSPVTSVLPSEAIDEVRLIDVQTDKYRLQIDTRGGTVVKALLEEYPVSVDHPEIKIQLLGTDPADYFIAQSGLLSADKTSAPTHQAVFTSAQSKYVMADDADSLQVELVWQSDAGVKVHKIYTFNRGSHNVQLTHRVENGSAGVWTGREYRQLKRGEPADSGNVFMYTYTGAAIYSPEDKYQKYSFDKLAEGELDRDVVNGWIAMIQHYFLAAYVPPRGETEHFYGKQVADGRYLVGSFTPSVKLAPGESHDFTGSLFIGPKLQHELEKVAEGLELTVDYGWLSVIAQPIFWILEWINSIVGNWGWTIIIFTILIKGVFFKLSETSYKSMANMRKLTPRIQALKDRYGDDKQRMQQAMMELYKTEKINPLGGCLPMLVQMPFFIALYWVLLESVEMRQAPFILWIQDLSIKDPYFVLPLLMGATMIVQQKLNPAPPDPMQAKMMMILPVVFTAMFAFFPAGLVLYWFVNNLLSIAQQWVITRRIEQGAKD